MTGRATARNVYRLVRSRLRSHRDASFWGDLGLLAPAVRRMAETGAGTDECLGHGCLPMLVHYDSPVPDVADLRARHIWDRRSAMAGINMRESQQLALLAEPGREFGAECRRPHAPSHKTRVIATAVQRNEEDGRERQRTRSWDPCPSSTVERLGDVGHVLRQRVELLDVDVFRTLGESDVLFVDSGDTVRAGGDVNFIVLDVLPVLVPGSSCISTAVPSRTIRRDVFDESPISNVLDGGLPAGGGPVPQHRLQDPPP